MEQFDLKGCRLPEANPSIGKYLRLFKNPLKNNFNSLGLKSFSVQSFGT